MGSQPDTIDNAILGHENAVTFYRRSALECLLDPFAQVSYSLPISPAYRKPVFQAVALQVVIGLFSLMILDGGTTAQICGIALVAFWGGAVVLIWRRPQSPTQTDLALIRFGYLPLTMLAFFLAHFIWSVRGLE